MENIRHAKITVTYYSRVRNSNLEDTFIKKWVVFITDWSHNAQDNMQSIQYTQCVLFVLNA